jgi:hypothetical protein
MEIKQEGWRLWFRGTLDEHTSGAEVYAALQSAAACLPSQSSKDRVILDFSAVVRANSVGILTWLKTMESLNPRVSFVNVPLWLVEQFNFSDALRGDCLVESFYAPFYSPLTDTHSLFCLRIGVDVPLLKSYRDFEMSFQGKEGEVFEPDFEPEELFHFLETNCEKFSKAGQS